MNDQEEKLQKQQINLYVLKMKVKAYEKAIIKHNEKVDKEQF